MGNSGGNARGNPERDAEVRQAMKARLKDFNTVMKILLLGAGSSGKSTILKQIAMLHGRGIADDVRKSYKSRIAYNILVGMLEVIRATSKFENITDPKSMEFAKVITDVTEKSDSLKARLTPSIVEALQYLFKDPAVQSVIKESFRFQLEDSWVEFMSRLGSYPDWGGEDWMPKDEDILLARVRTTGIVHEAFQVEGKKFEIYDVGGQRAERKKWFSLFNGVHAMIFVTSLSEYNQTLFEEVTANRLTESLSLWRESSQRPQFEYSALLLFFNKIDLFKQKYYVEKKELFNPFPGVFEEPPSVSTEKDAGCDNALNWFEKLFLSVAPKSKRDQVYVHVTCALDKQQMDAVIEACSTFVLQECLKASGLLPNFNNPEM